MDSPQTDEIIDDNLENFERQEQIITIPIIKYPPKVEKKPTKLLDFQLCFPINTTDLGRSYVSLHRPIGYSKKTKKVHNFLLKFNFFSTESTIPSKFYSKYGVQDDKSLSTEAIQKDIEILLGEPPYKKYKRPITENQRYQNIFPTM